MIKHMIIVVAVLLALVQGDESAVSGAKQVTTKDIIFYDSTDPKTGQITGGVMLGGDDCPCLQSVGDSLVDQERADTCNSCVRLVYNGDPSGKLDVIFIATHFYPETGPGSKFAQDVDLMLVKFFGFPQFADNLTKINFYRVDCIDPYDECEEISQNPVCHNKNKLRALASHCPGYDPGNNDQIVVLFNGDVAPFAAAIGERGFAYMPSNKHLFMIHEFGHSFAGLGDEYDKGFVTGVEPEYPNCASQTPGYTCAEKWGDLMGQGGVGCRRGCGYSNWYRPTYSACVERDEDIDHFCPVCAREVDNLLSIYSGITSVALLYFTVEREHDGAILRWEVAEASADHEGFYVYRAEGKGVRERISNGILSGNTSYEFVDETAPFRAVDYWLQEKTRTGEEYWYGPATLPAAAMEEFPLALQQNYPNPFNPTTTISFVVPARVRTTLGIFDLQGRRVATLLDEVLDAGFKEYSWDAKDVNGTQVSTGVYFYRLTAGDKTLTKKMILLK